MALTLIKEFQQKEEQMFLTEAVLLCESVENFLQPIINRLEDSIKSGKSPFEGVKSLDKKWVSEVIGVLMGMRNPSDAGMLDGLDGNLKKLFTFYSVLGDKDKAGATEAHKKNAERAESYIHHWATTSFKSSVQDMVKQLDLFSVNNPEDANAKNKFVNQVKKLSYELGLQKNKLRNKIASSGVASAVTKPEAETV